MQVEIEWNLRFSSVGLLKTVNGATRGLPAYGGSRPTETVVGPQLAEAILELIERRWVSWGVRASCRTRGKDGHDGAWPSKRDEKRHA